MGHPPDASRRDERRRVPSGALCAALQCGRDQLVVLWCPSHRHVRTMGAIHARHLQIFGEGAEDDHARIRLARLPTGHRGFCKVRRRPGEKAGRPVGAIAAQPRVRTAPGARFFRTPGGADSRTPGVRAAPCQLVRALGREMSGTLAGISGGGGPHARGARPLQWWRSERGLLPVARFTQDLLLLL